MNQNTRNILIALAITLASVLGMIIFGLVPAKWGLMAMVYVVVGAAYRTIYANRR